MSMSDAMSKAKRLAGDTWGGISSAVSTQWQIRRLQKQIADLVEERDRVLLEMGQKVYALYGRDKVRNADLLGLCRQIEDVGRQIEGLNQQIRALSEPKAQGELGEADLEDETAVEEAEATPAEEAPPETAKAAGPTAETPSPDAENAPPEGES
jgi:regulator of replication initiation timing